MDGTESPEAVTSVVERVAEHVVSFQNPDGGWGSTESDISDPWSTAEVIYVLSRLPSEYVSSREQLEDAVSDGVDYLLAEQVDDGSYISAEYGDAANVPTTAWVLMAFQSVNDRFRVDGELPDAMKDAYDWILGKQLEAGGWIDEQRDIPLEARNGEVYSTACGIKALSALKRRSLRSARINSGVWWLTDARNEGEGWGPIPNTQPDPTSTTCCLDGLLDAAQLYGIEVNRQVFRESIAWLLANQHAKGTWSDWQGITHSVESTSHATRILIRVGVGRDARPVQRAVDWLLETVHERGWYQDPNSDTSVSIWVTVNALEALLYYVGNGYQVDETTDEKQLLYNPQILSLTTFPSQRRWKQVAFWTGLIATILAAIAAFVSLII